MKRILYFGMSNNLGGIESFIINYYRKIDKSKFKIDFVKTQDKICFEKEIIDSGSKIYQIEPRRKNFIKYYVELYQLLKKHKEYKIIHVHLNTLSSIEPCIIGKMTGKKVVVHSHNAWSGKKLITKVLTNVNRCLINKVSDEQLACSEIAGKYMFKNKKFCIIKNAIDAKKFIYNFEVRKKIRKEFNISNEFLIGIVGRLEAQKNHIFILKVLKEVLKNEENIKLIIIGNGSLREKLFDYCKQQKIDSKVIFAGERNDVNEILQALDLFVMPSKFEGLGIVAIEAQAAGLKTLVSEAIPKEAYVTELIESISIENPIEWKNKIIQCYKTQTERRNTLKEIEDSGYDIDNEVTKLEKIYDNL